MNMRPGMAAAHIQAGDYHRGGGDRGGGHAHVNLHGRHHVEDAGLPPPPIVQSSSLQRSSVAHASAQQEEGLGVAEMRKQDLEYLGEMLHSNPDARLQSRHELCAGNLQQVV